tara:strand:- start:658 stop:828 length:171 start_codon:yes stop_codon:yes gene_type:complete
MNTKLEELKSDLAAAEAWARTLEEAAAAAGARARARVALRVVRIKAKIAGLEEDNE